MFSLRRSEMLQKLRLYTLKNSIAVYCKSSWQNMITASFPLAPYWLDSLYLVCVILHYSWVPTQCGWVYYCKAAQKSHDVWEKCNNGGRHGDGIRAAKLMVNVGTRRWITVSVCVYSLCVAMPWWVSKMLGLILVKGVALMTWHAVCCHVFGACHFSWTPGWADTKKHLVLPPNEKP